MRETKTDPIDREAMAKELFEWRTRRGYTQREVADMFGVSRYTIMRAENCEYLSLPTAYKVLSKLTQELRKEGGL